MLETDSPHPNHQFGAMYTYPAGVISLTDFSAALRNLQKTAFQMARRQLTEPQQLKHRPAIELGRILVAELVDMLLYWNQKEEPRTLKQLSQDLEYCTKFWTAFSAYVPSKSCPADMIDALTDLLLEDYQKLTRLIGTIIQGPTWHYWTVLYFGDNTILVDRGDYRIVQWHLAQELAANKANKGTGKTLDLSKKSAANNSSLLDVVRPEDRLILDQTIDQGTVHALMNEIAQVIAQHDAIKARHGTAPDKVVLKTKLQK